MYRQGDVLVKKIEKLPEGLKEKDKVIAYGEVTGHKHQFKTEQVLVFENAEHNQFLDVKQESILEHDTHKQVILPKGKYEVVIQREFDVLQQVRNVLD